MVHIDQEEIIGGDQIVVKTGIGHDLVTARIAEILRPAECVVKDCSRFEGPFNQEALGYRIGTIQGIGYGDAGTRFNVPVPEILYSYDHMFALFQAAGGRRVCDLLHPDIRDCQHHIHRIADRTTVEIHDGDPVPSHSGLCDGECLF